MSMDFALLKQPLVYPTDVLKNETPYTQAQAQEWLNLPAEDY